MRSNEALEAIPPEARGKFPVLHRVSRMLVGCSRLYAKNRYVSGLFDSFTAARPFMEACVAHPQFETMADEQKAPLMALMKSIKPD